MEISKQVTEERKWVKLSEGVLDKKKEKEKGKKKRIRSLNSRICGTDARTHTQRSIQLSIYTVTHIPITYTQAQIYTNVARE